MGTCPTHHGILTDNLPEGFNLPYTISMIASAPIVPGLHAIMTALDLSDILRRSNGLPVITTVTILLVRSAIFSNNTCCSSGKVRNALLAASPDWDSCSPSTHTTVSSWVIVSSHCSSLGLSDNSCSTCHTLHSSSERILHPVIHSASICFFCKTSSIVSTASCSPKIDQRLNSSLDAV